MIAPAVVNQAGIDELIMIANRLVYYALLAGLWSIALCAVIGFIWFCKWLVEQLEQ